jgi:hypothetical protein
MAEKDSLVPFATKNRQVREARIVAVKNVIARAKAG